MSARAWRYRHNGYFKYDFVTAVLEPFGSVLNVTIIRPPSRCADAAQRRVASQMRRVKRRAARWVYKPYQDTVNTLILDEIDLIS